MTTETKNTPEAQEINIPIAPELGAKKDLQPLKQAMLNDPVNGFGMPDPLTYLKNEQPDLTGRRLPKGMLVDPKASIPQNFQITNTLYFANGEPALLLLTELK